MELILKLTREDIEEQLRGYAVMVEMFNRTKTFRVGMKYESTFTKAEREILSKYYVTFYRWHVNTGLPETFSIEPSTLQLLQRAINFFGSL